MNNFIINIRDFIVQRKIWLMRSTGYMGVVNSAMIILVLLKIGDESILRRWAIPIIIGWVILLIFIGWVETEILKVPQKETEKLLKINPVLSFIHKKVGEIDERLKKMEEKVK